MTMGRYDSGRNLREIPKMCCLMHVESGMRDSRVSKNRDRKELKERGVALCCMSSGTLNHFLDVDVSAVLTLLVIISATAAKRKPI